MPALLRRLACTALPAIALAFALGACRHGGTRAPTAAVAPAAAAAPAPPTLRVVAQVVLPTGMRFGEHEVGGLSGLAYDAREDLFYAVADDVSGHPPARVLRFRWHPPAPLELVDWLVLTGEAGPLPGAGADLEGLARAGSGDLYVSSEGDVKGGIAPWVGHFDASGRLLGRLHVPGAFLPAEARGVTNNAAFEALTLLDDTVLLAGTEGPLLQDEPPPPGELARTRILRWDLLSDRLPDEWAYPLDPPHAAPAEPGGLQVRGLVDLLDAGLRFLTLERSWVAGVGFDVKLFEATFARAERLDAAAALAGRPVETLRKRLIADLSTLGVQVDNYECMAWGRAQGIDRPLVILSDNNFNAPGGTLLLAVVVSGELTLEPLPLRIDRRRPLGEARSPS